MLEKLKVKIMKLLKVNSLREAKEEFIWVSKYIKRYHKIIILYFSLSLFSAVIAIFGTILSKHLIDTVTGFSKDSLPTVAVLYVLFGIVSITTSAISSRISTKYSTKVTNEIQYEIYKDSLDVEWKYLKKFRTGDLINRISSDVSNMSNSVLTWIPNFINKVVQAITCIAIIFYYDPVMALISIISTPVVVLCSRSLMYKIRVFSKKSREASSSIMSFIQESYSNMQSIKAFGIIEDFNLRFRILQDDYYSIVMAQNKFSIFMNVVMSLLGMLVSYGSYGWGVYRLWTGHITYGTMTLFIQLAGYLSSSFSGLVSMVPSAISSLTAVRRIIDVIDLPKEEIDESVDVGRIKEEAKEGGISIDIKDAVFSYDDSRDVFTCLSFDAIPGGVTAIVGPSGSGKTTIFRILLGIASIKEGKSQINYIFNGEKKIFNISASTRGLFAYVPQGNSIFEGTIADNIKLLNSKATDDEVIKALKASCAYDFVMKLDDGINSTVCESGSNFSEGQKQRLCIARALVSEAPIILLDEGTSALDSETERKLLENLSKYKGGSKTFVISTHRVSVLDICEKTYSIEDKALKEIK